VRRAEHLAVLLLDLDNFKTVNDTLGHAAGDQLLLIAAQRLMHCTRGSDVIARLGGDEFAVLLDNIRSDAEVRAIAERITAAMRDPFVIGTSTVVAGASVGIARTHDARDGVDELLRNADVAMYTAKANGKNRYEFFERAMYTAVVNRAGLEADLRRAVTEQEFTSEFTLVYQPLVQLGSGRVSGVEALLRWMHPRRGALNPLEFIPLAESTGLILPLGRAVLHAACQQVTEWTASGILDESASLSVNVSGRQLHDATFLDDVRSVLRESGLAPHRLVLEITETVIMQRTSDMLDRLRALKGLGIRLAIDDFGTGYSSLSYLQQFPVDILKIDKAFVDGIGHNGTDAALTRTIIGLGGTLGLRTVAEGIELAQQETLLHELGCDFGQGFLFAQPLDAQQMADALQRRQRPAD
jgi:diguanylate cyclase (GGDEF)-like protein